MDEKDTEQYSDFSNVEKQRNYLTAEEFPEGPFGSPIRKNEPVQNKSTPWEEGQRHYSAFNYEFKSGFPPQKQSSDSYVQFRAKGAVLFQSLDTNPTLGSQRLRLYMLCFGQFQNLVRQPHPYGQILLNFLHHLQSQHSRQFLID